MTAPSPPLPRPRAMGVPRIGRAGDHLAAHVAWSSPMDEQRVNGDWPPALLQAFVLRMAAHGMCVSRALMAVDRRYALQQLQDAHHLADDSLRLMAVQLFRHFESRCSGIPPSH